MPLSLTGAPSGSFMGKVGTGTIQVGTAVPLSPDWRYRDALLLSITSTIALGAVISSPPLRQSYEWKESCEASATWGA